MHDLIRRHSLATLVTMGTEDLIANHIPMVLEETEGAFGVLRGHVARQNSQWKESRQEVRALAIFQGPEAYITPSWYETKKETGRVVPTYDFAVVHAYGALTTFEDAEWLSAHVKQLTSQHEQRLAKPWSVEDAPDDYIQTMLQRIVGVQITIQRLEGKWKASQNMPIADRKGVVEGLIQSVTEPDREMAWLVPID